MMKDKMCGFILKQKREFSELNGTLVEMEHEKTGARLVWLDNGCDNKLFCVGFKTLPENSTGVFHILEHSVLCGSDKYPVKEPFLDLLKGSMNTFLNAMTYPDKTIYPVSSRNARDFLNLTGVYLDAVFAPALLRNPNIFYQEGWHLELGDEPGLKGVVFNEMKGAMSGVDDQIEQELLGLLFPDNCYRFNSGGDPEVIPELTYEDFVASYRRYYHPGNARFYLDGDIPLEETLALIDSYLSRYEKSEPVGEIPMQKPVCGEKTAYYEVADEEGIEKKAILSMGKILCTWEDRVKALAAQVLFNMLADTNDAPLCRAVLEAGLGEDFYMGLSGSIAQPYMMLQVRNMNIERADEAMALIRSTVEDLLRGGLDRQALEASLNRYAFRMRQSAEPQGVYRAMHCYNSWLYGGDVAMYLLKDDVIGEVRAMLNSDGFEKLLREMLLGDDWCILRMLPSTTVGEEKRQKEAALVKSMTDALTAEDAAAVEKRNETLLAWQQSTDTPEQLATLPTLPIEEIGEMARITETEESTVGTATVLYHPVPTEGVTHVNLYFDLTDYTLEELTPFSIVPALFSNLPTENYTAIQLQQAIKTYIGSLDFGVSITARDGETAAARPTLKVAMSVLDEHLEKGLELVLEILRTTRFDAPDSIRRIVLQADEEGKQHAVMAGHAMAAYAVQAHYTARAAVNEAISGYTGLQWLHGFARSFDEKLGDFTKLLERLQKETFCQSRLRVGVTATEKKDLSAFIACLPEGTSVPTSAAYQTALPKRLGIAIPAQIAFASKGYHLSLLNESGNGSLSVASNILSLDYLWNAIRVQGGAYGTGMQGSRDGMLLTYSYRDPSPARSLSVYDEMGNYLRNFEENLDRYIISTVSSAQPLLTAQQKGTMADERWFSGIGREVLEKRHAEMLKTDHAALAAWQAPLDAMAADGAVCVVGYADALAQCDGLEIRQL